MKLIDKLHCPADYDCYYCKHYSDWKGNECYLTHQVKRDLDKNHLARRIKSKKFILCENYEID